MKRRFSICTLILLPIVALGMGNEKEEKKQLEAKAKTVAEQAKALEKQDHLLEARSKYAEAQGITPTREAEGGAYRVEREIDKRVKKQLDEAKPLYDGGKYQDAINSLNKASELQPGNPSVNYNLALCYLKLNDRPKSVEYLGRGAASTNDAKEKQRLEQLIVSITTGESVQPLNDVSKSRVAEFNTLASKLDMESPTSEAASPEDDSNHGAVVQAALKSPLPPAPQPQGPPKKTSEVSLCDRLKELRSSLPQSPAVIFNLARCAEQEGRVEDSVQLFNQYLQLAPNAVDGQDVQLRIEDLASLAKITDSKGSEVRKLYATASRDLDDHKYGRALASYQKADSTLPDFPQTKRRLGLMYEMLGNTDKAREYFAAYKSLVKTDAEKTDADSHLNTFDEKTKQYRQNVAEAHSILNELLDRWTGIEPDAASQAASPAHSGQPHTRRRPSWGSDVPYEYAQHQLGLAAGKLQLAHAIFRLAPEVNEMLAFVYMQGNSPHDAGRHFDAVASQNLPVVFYAEMYDSKDRKAPHHVKCELGYDTLRIVDLAVYDPKAKTYMAPAKPAGSDGLGNFVQLPSDTPPPGDPVAFKIADLKQVETKNSMVRIGLADKELELMPLNFTGPTPYVGAASRKFANPYTKLFKDYLGIEDAKLGKEGMTGGEKFMMGMSMAAAGFSAYSAIASAGMMMNSAQTMFALSNALNTSVSTLQQSVIQQRQLLQENQFKLIPQEPFQLTFREDLR